MSDQFVRNAKPEEAFAALSNEIRVGILRSLREADGREATFSDLRAAVGVDDPGKFNYHLGELAGRFVARTEEGYRLTQAGKQIVGAIASGAYTIEGTIEPIYLDDPCRACGGAQTLHYEDEVVRVACESCPATCEFAVPPAVFAGYDRESIPEVAGRYLRTTIRRQYDDFCWYCDGPLRPTVGPAAALEPAEVVSEEALEEADGPDRNRPWVRFDCRRCGAAAATGLETALLDHPAVAGFYHDCGIDVRARRAWEFPPADAVETTVRARDPVRASVTYGADEDSLTVVVDETLDVVDVES